MSALDPTAALDKSSEDEQDVPDWPHQEKQHCRCTSGYCQFLRTKYATADLDCYGQLLRKRTRDSLDRDGDQQSKPASSVAAPRRQLAGLPSLCGGTPPEVMGGPKVGGTCIVRFD